MELDAKIYIAGHAGMAGSAVRRRLEHEGYRNIVGKRSSELDLTRQADVEDFFAGERPEYVFLCAAKVGGILANNTYPAEFIYVNSAIQSNVIESARRFGVKKLLFLGSSCIYPKFARQPIREECLLTGELEKTNEAYAIAKIAGLKMCEFYNRQYGTNFISAMPTNLYGYGDNYHLENSHVLPGLIRRFGEAVEKKERSVTVWGTGKVMREFLHVDDMADACLFLMRNYIGNTPVNVGCGEDVSIRAVAEMIAGIMGFSGEIVQDISKPDGTPRKLLDCSRLFAMGWKPKIGLEEGLRITCEDYLKNRSMYRS